MIEHLLSPTHCLAEAFRIAKPGGYLLVTTPNVTRIGSLFKLAIGRSNLDQLIPLDYDRPDDEHRPHYREYSMTELASLCQRAGFEVVERRHFQVEESRRVRSLRQRLIDCAKVPFYAVPHFRGNLLVVARKPVGGR